MKVSVIIPSRLQVNPGSPAGELWLDRALATVRDQTVCSQVAVEVVVGLDPGFRLPDRFPGLVAANGREARQACAVNAAVAASSGEVLAILEDDDLWHPRRLEYGLQLLGRYDVVTSNQKEVNWDGTYIKIGDFPTPSGWLLARSTWDRLGPFDESYRFHVDTEYLGRMIAAPGRRVHLVENSPQDRSQLREVLKFSDLGRTREAEPLVVRTVNPHGGMALILREDWAMELSMEEHRIMVQKYGTVPW